MRYLICLCLCFVGICSGALAAEGESVQVQLASGKWVELRPDFTWHYIEPTTEQRNEALAAPAMVQPLQPQVLQQPVWPIQQLTSETLVLQQAGVQAEVQYDGETELSFQLTNTGFQPITHIDLLIRVVDAQGTMIAEYPHNAWQAIKRMPETYLRPNQTQPGLTLKLNEPAPANAKVQFDLIGLQRR